MVSLTKALAVLGLITVGQAQIPAFFEDVEQLESICNTDESQNNVCYKDSEPAKVSKSKAIARLRLNYIGSWCTGWLFGSEGHLMTNHHCINSADAAAFTRVEFDAVTPGCQDSSSRGSHPGKIAAENVTVIFSDRALDFALVKVNLIDEFDLTPYGYLQASDQTVKVNDTAYVMGHPNGRPRRIAMVKDGAPTGRITTTNYTEAKPSLCLNVDRLGHNLDTEKGSSGTPLLSATTNLVIGLHNCGGCKAATTAYGANYAIKMTYIINLLLPSKCSLIEDNTDYAGFDVASTSRVNAADCCADCDGIPGCKLFVWSYFNGGTCWLKSQVGIKVTSVGVKSAVLTSPVTTSPPPPTPSPSLCLPAEANYDFPGNDISYVSSRQFKDCCAVCTNTPGCNFYVWTDYNSGTCWLKSNQGSDKVLSFGSRAAFAPGGGVASTCSPVEVNTDYAGEDIAGVA
ncbi:hypothetical protein DYB30_003470, partial [Aphanomyces astaci]